ncbi:MAG: hypothetical protein JWN46_3129 [Acidimicrobiales bacterium]|nr:hypothetical protein [Acidimicrobiales bacterium]
METPAARVKVEPSPKRVRIVFAGEIVADTTRALLVWEGPHYPQYYVPIADARSDLLVPSEHTSRSPSRGNARYLTLRAGGREAVDAAWEFPDSPVAELRGHLRFEWSAADHWFEEDEEVFVHPRSPYVRIDALRSSRLVQVRLFGELVAESSRATLLFETGLRTRYYLPPTDVRLDLLVPSATTSQCPYKGTASYHSVRVGDAVAEDVVWHYPSPFVESAKIAGLLAFWPEREPALEILVDGTPAAAR